jgi:hypothetical protein
MRFQPAPSFSFMRLTPLGARQVQAVQTQALNLPREPLWVLAQRLSQNLPSLPHIFSSLSMVVLDVRVTGKRRLQLLQPRGVRVCCYLLRCASQWRIELQLQR